jgi:hypothetical protein
LSVNRRFWILLNLALAGTLVWATLAARDAWRASKAHQRATLTRPATPPPALPWQPLPNSPAVLPAAYKDVAQRDLLDRSRDPNVPVELPPPPPPPPPVPPLPVYHGYMNLDGPIAILSMTKNSAHEAVHPGEKIGEFILLSVNMNEIELGWRDRVIRKPVDALEDHSTPAVQAAAARYEITYAPPSLTSAPGPPPPPGPGEKTHFGIKLCTTGDTSEVGAVVDGYRKVSSPTPFGASCFWEPVQ